MANKFRKGDIVKLNMVVPEGMVESFRMDEDGTVYCLFEWKDLEGNKQKRWFKEEDLIRA